MVSPLVSEGAVVSEGVVYSERRFQDGQCPRSSSFWHCVRNAWPPCFGGGCGFGRSRSSIVYAMLGSLGFGGGCCFGNVHANTDEMSVFASWRWCLFYPMSCAAQGLGVSFQAESLRWRVHCPLRHRSLHNQAATDLSPAQHARVSYHTQSRETTNTTNRYPSSALGR